MSNWKATLPKNFSSAKPRNATDGLQYSRKDFSQLIQKAEFQQAAINQLQEEYHQRLSDLEQMIRSNTVRMFGVEEVLHEDTFLVVLEVLKQRMQLMQPVEMSDLESCFRLGVNTSKPRPVVVRFTSRRVKNMVLRTKKALKGTNMGISEDLSPERAQLYNEASRQFGRKNVWIEKGCVKVSPPSGDRVRLQSLGEMEEFLRTCQ